MYILAHDLGTSGNKATLFDESGLLIASRTAAYPTDYASGNRAEQNPLHWWKAIVDTTQLTQHGHFSNWYHPMILPE